MITLPVTCNEIIKGFTILCLLGLGWLWYAGLVEGSTIALGLASATTLIVLIFAFVFYGDKASNFFTRNIRCKCDNND